MRILDGLDVERTRFRAVPSEPFDGARCFQAGSRMWRPKESEPSVFRRYHGQDLRPQGGCTRGEPTTCRQRACIAAFSATQSVDVGVVLSEMADMKGGGGNYQTSIVDKPGHALAQVHRPWIGASLAGEGEQLSGELRAALCSGARARLMHAPIVVSPAAMPSA
jgi:hypothetical protein